MSNIINLWFVDTVYIYFFNTILSSAFAECHALDKFSLRDFYQQSDRLGRNFWSALCKCTFLSISRFHCVFLKGSVSVQGTTFQFYQLPIPFVFKR